MIKAVIFDMDGVLADTDRVRFLLLKEFLGKRGFVLSDKDYKRSVGARTKEFLKELFGEAISGDEINDIYEKLRAEPNINGQPHAFSCCERLSRTFTLAIGSGSQRERIQLVLKTLGINNFFSKIIGSDKIKRHKPDPETYFECLKALGLKGNQCVVIEDSPRGVMSAKKAGCYCIGVIYAHTEEELFLADLVIPNLDCLTKELIATLY